jgi:methionyl-tRNA formyltransferase
VKVLASRLVEGSGTPGTVLDDDLSIACADGAVRLVKLQRAGGKPLAADDFQRGGRIAKCTVVS